MFYIGTGVARKLIDADPGSLEATARKVRTVCYSELEVIAVTGCIQADGRLRSALILAAVMLKVDIQELESVNSMIKIACARAGNNRISLELLSSRIGIRKTITSSTHGSTKFAALTSIASHLARSCFLHFDSHKSMIEDAERWRASCDVLVLRPTWDHNPDLKPTKDQLWAVKYNKLFTQRAKQHVKTDSHHVLVLVVAYPDKDTHSGIVEQLFGLCEIYGANTSVCRLKPFTLNGVTMYQWDPDNEAPTQPTIRIIALLYDLSIQIKRIRHTTRIGIELHSEVMRVECTYLCSHRAPDLLANVKAPYERKQKTSEDDMATLALEDNESEPSENEQDDGDDDDENDDGSHIASAVEKRLQRDDKFVRMLLGWDDVSDDDDESESDSDNNLQERKDIDDAETLNTKIAAEVANKQLGWSTAVMRTVDHKVEQLLQSGDFGDKTASSVDLEQDALLQEVFINPKSLCEPTCDMDMDTGHGFDQVSKALPVSEEMLDDAFTHWQVQLFKSCYAIKTRFNDSSAKVGRNRELSLVAMVDKVAQSSKSKSSSESCSGGDVPEPVAETMSIHLVQWVSNESSRKGRSIRLDESACIICPVNYIQQAMSFQGCFIIWPAIGARVRKDYRQECPGLVLRVLRMYETAVSANVHETEKDLYFEQSSKSHCAVCNGEGRMMVCAWCSCAVHPECSEKLKGHITTSPDRSNVLNFKGPTGKDDVFSTIKKQMIPAALLAPPSTQTTGEWLLGLVWAIDLILWAQCSDGRYNAIVI